MSLTDAPAWKFLRLWHILVIGGILLTFGFTLWWRDERDPCAAEKVILSNLSIYNPQYVLDEENHVEDLNLEGPEVTDDAIKELGKLAHLRRLSLKSSSVTDVGIRQLSQLRRLKRLDIANTNVTDRGLKNLEQAKSLRWVFVSENKRLTSRGIASLQRALPAVHVVVVNRVLASSREQNSPRKRR